MEQMRALVVGGNRQAWKLSDRPGDADVVSGIESWVYALKGEYMWGGRLRSEHLARFDTIILNLNPELLLRYERLLQVSGARGRVIGLYEGGLADLHSQWRRWSRVADRCDLVVAINGHGLSFLRSLTTTRVEHVGIPYPVEGVRRYRTPVEERQTEIHLCSPLLSRPLDYLAARPLGVAMIGYEKTFARRVHEIRRHRSLDPGLYTTRAKEVYDDPLLEVLMETTPQRYLERAGRARVWMNLDTRYTWGRNVLDGAALGVPVISTRETWHATSLFPDLVVNSPYDIDGATALAARLLSDDRFYLDVVTRAEAAVEEYSPERVLSRLLQAGGIERF